MKLEEILVLVNSCKTKAENALKRTDLTNKQREEIEGLHSTICYYSAYFENNTDIPQEKLDGYATQFTELYKYLKQIEVPVSIMARPETSLVKVKKVIPPKEQKEKTKKDKEELWNRIKKILIAIGTGLGVAAIITLLVLALKSCEPNKNENTDDLPGLEQTDDDLTKPIDKLDIDDYDSLLTYAQDIQSKLPADSGITIEDIMYAIRLANFDRLENKAVFQDREEIHVSTRVTGQIVSELGSDAIIQKDLDSDIFLSDHDLTDIIMCATDNKISIDEFKECKTEKGYDIYAVADRLVKGIKANNENDVYFAKIFNDLLARKAVAYSITPNSPISTYYTLLGVYNQNAKRLLELTSGLGTSVYGNGVRIDGYYGFTCVEELEAYLHIGNEKNGFYTFRADMLTEFAKDESKTK